MKKIQYILGLLFLAATTFIWSCKKEYEAAGPEPNTALIRTSFGTGANIIQVNGQMSFIDLSRGVASRKWTFPDFTLGMDSNKIETSSEAVVKVRFTKPGIQEVRLQQTFDGKVWVGNTQKDVNTFDTIITVKVLDSVKATFVATRVQNNTTLVNKDDANNEVTAGKNIQFTSTSLGEPETYTWVLTRKDGLKINLSGANPQTKLSSLGVYDMLMIASNKFGRDTVKYQNYIKVIPSTEPVELLSVKGVDKKIELEFSRDMENPATNNPASFTLVVTNNNKTYPVKVASASRKPGKDNVLVLNTDLPIYNSDDIKVSYDATKGNLVTTDAMKATSFTDQSVVFVNPNILATVNYDFSFENSSNSNWAYMFWGGIWEKYTLSVSTAKARTGTKSGYLQMQPGGGAIFSYRNNANEFIRFPAVKGKTYEIGMWVNVESLGDKTSTPDIRFYWDPATDWGVGPVSNFTSTFPVNQWVFTKAKVTFSDNNNFRFQIRGHNEFNTQQLKVYIDDISLSELELRP